MQVVHVVHVVHKEVSFQKTDKFYLLVFKNRFFAILQKFDNLYLGN